ncbi:hypothetical protein O1M54_49895 [Streptomyces diastatochromogenes]|nr:hypothetical protein [Streptomyces diastatochromogenes]
MSWSSRMVRRLAPTHTQGLQGSLDQARGGGGQEPSAARPKRTADRKTVRKPAAEAAKEGRWQEGPPRAARASTAGGGRGGTKTEWRQLRKAELYQRAAEQGIVGRPKMSRRSSSTRSPGPGAAARRGRPDHRLPVGYRTVRR